MQRHGLKEPIMVNWDNTFQFDLQQLRLTNLLTGRQCALTRNEGFLLQALVDGISTKQDLIAEVWTRHHAVVTENSYYQLVSLLRKSFGSIDLPGAIVTLPRKGLSLAHSAPRDECAPAVGATVTLAPMAAEIDFEGRPIPAVDRMPVHARPSAAASGQCAGAVTTRRWAHLGGRRTIPAIALGCAVLITALWVPFHRDGAVRPSQTILASDTLSFASAPQSSLVIGNTTISYTKMPADTAVRVWHDVQARAEIPLEQTRRVYIAQHRNRYAVLACSEPLDPQNVRCLTITIPV
jgi:DNA-binding winged helix-turn-helix (wHTH) protein